MKKLILLFTIQVLSTLAFAEDFRFDPVVISKPSYLARINEIVALCIKARSHGFTGDEIPATLYQTANECIHRNKTALDLTIYRLSDYNSTYGTNLKYSPPTTKQ